MHTLNFDRTQVLSIRTMGTEAEPESIIHSMLHKNMPDNDLDHRNQLVDKINGQAERSDMILDNILKDPALHVAHYWVTIDGNMNWPVIRHPKYGAVRTLKLRIEWVIFNATDTVLYSPEQITYFLIKADTVKFDQKNSMFDIVDIVEDPNAISAI